MWFIIGIALGIAALGFAWFTRGKSISLTWYDWVIGIISVALLLFGVVNLIGSFAESEAMAGWMMLLIFGLPALILLAIDWQLIARRQRAG